MDEEPAVSAVIPFFGDPAPTLQLIEQLRGQVGAAVEIIISDDVSPVPFPGVDDVVVVRRERNGGFGAAVNSGVAVATRELVLILNSDIQISADFVSRMVREAAPYQPCVAGPVLLEGQQAIPAPTARDFPRARHYAVEWCTPLVRVHSSAWWRRAHGHDLRARPGLCVKTDWVVGAAMLIRRADFLAVGGMDEDFFMNCEEVDLQMRLADVGVPAVYLGTVSCHHEGGGSSDPTQRGQWVLDARFYLMEKQRGWSGRLAMAAALYAVTGVNFVSNCLRSTYNNAVEPKAVFRQEVRMIRGHAGPAPLVPAEARR